MEYEPEVIIRDFYQVAPISTIVLIILGIGFYAGWRSRTETIETLKQWLDSLRKK